MKNTTDTICAPATAPGGALTVIRVSGPDALSCCDRIFRPAKGEDLESTKGYTARFGMIAGDNGEVVDEVIATVFRSPRSFTGENMVEISCHGSRFVRGEILRLLGQAGCRAASPGEFTLRAFLNGKMDLSQAEAVADLIASETAASHRLAMNQLRGGYSGEFEVLRSQLLELASLLELELDFGEEEVEFADRKRLGGLMDRIKMRIDTLADSFRLGNTLKNGIPVAIVGSPNVGKSTLLNALLNEERALVSDVPGTTRDSIEDTVHIGSLTFRFVDTAGIRDTGDPVERMGIERTFRSMEKAEVILMTTVPEEDPKTVECRLANAGTQRKKVLLIINKMDTVSPERAWEIEKRFLGCGAAELFPVSLKTGRGIEELKAALTGLYPEVSPEDTVVSNLRHYELLKAASGSLEGALNGLECGLPTDLLTEEVRDVLRHLGAITGEVTGEDILHSIFGKFCIGK